MGELKPCPKCTSRNVDIMLGATGRYIQCLNCGMQTVHYPHDRVSIDKLKEKWNNRPLEDSKDAQIKELRDALESQPKWESCSIENGDSDMPHDSADYYLVHLGDEEGFVDEPYIDYIDTCADTGFTWFANDTERLAKAYLPIHTPKLTEELK